MPCYVLAEGRTRAGLHNVRFSNRPVLVKRFQTIHRYGVDVAQGQPPWSCESGPAHRR